MANVGTYAGKDSSLLSYLLFSIKILVDGQPIGYEAFLDTMHETDLEEIGKLFVSEEDLKKLIIPIEDIIFLARYTSTGINEVLDFDVPFF